MNEEHNHLDRIIANMSQSGGGVWMPETRQLAHNFLADEMARIANEDPEELIICCCHGEYHPAKIVDVWGICHPEWLE